MTHLPNHLGYDRQEKAYLVTDDTGTIHQFPSGRRGKTESERFAIRLLSPSLAGLVDKITENLPAVESRAWKAARVVLSGGVKMDTAPNVLATIEGEGDDYNITAHDGVYICDCDGCRQGYAPLSRAGQPLCSHIIAFIFELKLN